MLSRLLQRRRERAELAELVKLNARRLHDFVLEVATAQQSPAGDFVACLDGTKSPPDIRVVRRSLARDRFAEFRLAGLDAVPERGVTYVAGVGGVIEAGVIANG